MYKTAHSWFWLRHIYTWHIIRNKVKCPCHQTSLIYVFFSHTGVYLEEFPLNILNFLEKWSVNIEVKSFPMHTCVRIIITIYPEGFSSNFAQVFTVTQGWTTLIKGQRLGHVSELNIFKTHWGIFVNAISQESREGISSNLVQRSTWTQEWPVEILEVTGRATAVR